MGKFCKEDKTCWPTLSSTLGINCNSECELGLGISECLQPVGPKVLQKYICVCGAAQQCTVVQAGMSFKNSEKCNFGAGIVPKKAISNT